MTFERLKDILISFIDEELESADPDYVRDLLGEIMTKEEMEELELTGWLMIEDE